MKGHIRERSPGHWAIILDTHDATGKRKRRWHSFAGTKREAQIQCAKLVSEAQGGGAIDPSRVTLNEYLDRFLRDWVPLHLVARSVERYTGSLGHARRHLGDRRLQSLRPADVAGPGACNPATRSCPQRLGQAPGWAALSACIPGPGDRNAPQRNAGAAVAGHRHGCRPSDGGAGAGADRRAWDSDQGAEDAPRPAHHLAAPSHRGRTPQPLASTARAAACPWHGEGPGR